MDEESMNKWLVVGNTVIIVVLCYILGCMVIGTFQIVPTVILLGIGLLVVFIWKVVIYKSIETYYNKIEIEDEQKIKKIKILQKCCLYPYYGFLLLLLYFFEVYSIQIGDKRLVCLMFWITTLLSCFVLYKIAKDIIKGVSKG